MKEYWHYFQPTRNWKEEVQGRGLGATGARQIADHLAGVPYDTYVEPFLGRGDILRAMRPHGKVVLNDLDCDRIRQAGASLCRQGGGSACRLLPKATCGRDWSESLKEDSPSTLFVLDPPWEGARARGMNYSYNEPITASEVARRTRDLKGTVAVVYGDYPEARKTLCTSPFRCHRIHKNFFGRPFTQLLAIKPARRSLK